jgi:hypothetical protein
MDGRAEWLGVDGRGGFASGTVGFAHRRRYHAPLLRLDRQVLAEREGVGEAA